MRNVSCKFVCLNTWPQTGYELWGGAKLKVVGPWRWTLIVFFSKPNPTNSVASCLKLLPPYTFPAVTDCVLKWCATISLSPIGCLGQVFCYTRWKGKELKQRPLFWTASLHTEDVGQLTLELTGGFQRCVPPGVNSYHLSMNRCSPVPLRRNFYFLSDCYIF